MKKGEKVYRFDTFLRTHLGAALGVDFRDLGSFLAPLKLQNMANGGSKKQLKKQDLTKMNKKLCRPKTVTQAAAMCSPKRTFQNSR